MLMSPLDVRCNSISPAAVNAAPSLTRGPTFLKAAAGVCDELELATSVAMNPMADFGLDSVSCPFTNLERAGLVSLFDGGGDGLFAVCRL